MTNRKPGKLNILTNMQITFYVIKEGKVILYIYKRLINESITIKIYSSIYIT